jgi:hypothetical protein
MNPGGWQIAHGRGRNAEKEEHEMNRRELFGAVGAAGAGLTLGGATLLAHDHGGENGGANKFMAPISNHHLFFCGFHVAKKNPKFQVTTMHYCGMRGEGDHAMHQCLLYDSVGPGAKLLGVEYIVSDKLFRSLPDEEKKYRHPHAYEVLSGGLIAPGMASEDELKFMKVILNTWGKTWHTWPDPTTPVPLGEPLLIWSLTGDGQADKELVAERDKQFGVSTVKLGAERVAAIGYQVPQVPPPKSIATIGRQWTATGEDRATPWKKSP